VDVERIPERIERAKQLLATVRHAAMATVNADGSPHNSPYRFIIDSSLEHLYWGSHPESQHSLNIIRTGQLFVVLYDAIERGGLYISGEEGHILEGDELAVGLAVHNAVREKAGEEALAVEYYKGDSPQRMWGARADRFWVNASKKGSDGHVLRDHRYEIKREDLLGF
jgi:hypothetical protein